MERIMSKFAHLRKNYLKKCKYSNILDDILDEKVALIMMLFIKIWWNLLPTFDHNLNDH